MKFFADLVGDLALLIGKAGVTYTPWFLFDEAECPEEINK